MLNILTESFKDSRKPDKKALRKIRQRVLPVCFALFCLLLTLTGCGGKQQGGSISPEIPKQAQSPTTVSGVLPQTGIIDDEKLPELDVAAIKPGNTPPAFKNKKDGSILVLIPAGEFVMGADKDDQQAKQNEKPAHRVQLDAYYINKYEVTYRQYKKFLKESGYKPVGNWDRFDLPEYKDHPGMNVTFPDAQAYCRWAGLNLPTEAQWEMAARGTENRKYPWGNQWDPNKCNNSETKDPHIIRKMNHIQDKRGSLPPGSVPADVSPFGIMDMAGNINEWCSDWYKSSYYKTSPSFNPRGHDKGAERVIRGGSWSLPPSRCRASARWSGSVDSDLDDYGFRCCLTIKK